MSGGSWRWTRALCENSNCRYRCRPDAGDEKHLTRQVIESENDNVLECLDRLTRCRMVCQGCAIDIVLQLRQNGIAIRFVQLPMLGMPDTYLMHDRPTMQLDSAASATTVSICECTSIVSSRMVFFGIVCVLQMSMATLSDRRKHLLAFLLGPCCCRSHRDVTVLQVSHFTTRHCMGLCCPAIPLCRSRST